MQRVELVDGASAARLFSDAGVVHLDPEPAAFSAMLEGWALQQRVRFLKAEGGRSR